MYTKIIRSTVGLDTPNHVEVLRLLFSLKGKSVLVFDDLVEAPYVMCNEDNGTLSLTVPPEINESEIVKPDIVSVAANGVWPKNADAIIMDKSKRFYWYCSNTSIAVDLISKGDVSSQHNVDLEKFTFILDRTDIGL